MADGYGYGSRNRSRDRDERHSDERSAFERGADEVRSWFGDDAAEQRRRRDKAHDPDTWHAETSSLGEERFGGRRRRSGAYDEGYARDYDTARGRSRSGRGSDFGCDDSGSGAGAGFSSGGRGFSGRSGAGMAAGIGGASGFGYAGERDRRDEWNDFGTDSKQLGGSLSSGSGRSARGGHYGRGPKNDTRSKERLHDRVCEQLHDDDELDAREIEVSTDENGEVTLTGAVNDRWEKRQAEDCAYRVRGARHVQNNLKVRAHDEGQQSQTSISPVNE